MRITVAIVTKPKRNVIYINRLLNSSGYFSHSFLILIQANSLLSDGNECTHIKPPAAAFNSFDITRLSFRASVCTIISICCTHSQSCCLQKNTENTFRFTVHLSRNKYKYGPQSIYSRTVYLWFIYVFIYVYSSNQLIRTTLMPFVVHRKQYVLRAYFVPCEFCAINSVAILLPSATWTIVNWMQNNL